MSNNKQTMKLYTEEQVVNALKRVFIESITFEDVNEVMSSLTPIEIPSDEEIKNEIGYDWFDPEDIAFFGGIDYLRSKIQGGKQ